jgi:hypothetical protein
LAFAAPLRKNDDDHDRDDDVEDDGRLEVTVVPTAEAAV